MRREKFIDTEAQSQHIYVDLLDVCYVSYSRGRSIIFAGNYREADVLPFHHHRFLQLYHFLGIQPGFHHFGVLLVVDVKNEQLRAQASP